MKELRERADINLVNMCMPGEKEGFFCEQGAKLVTLLCIKDMECLVLYGFVKNHLHDSCRWM